MLMDHVVLRILQNYQIYIKQNIELALQNPTRKHTIIPLWHCCQIVAIA